MSDLDHWFPIARGEEVVPRHVVQVQLQGQELAVWRDDAGQVNAWENRCPHRGVRLSIGINDGTELRCQYHGWRFASGSGQCSFIPAHPELTPPSSFRARPYAATEALGYVWASLGTPAEPPMLPSAWQGALTLRSIVVAAPAAEIAASLPGGTELAPFMISASGGLLALLQPVDAARTVIHSMAASAEGDRLAVLRHWNSELGALRDRLEARGAAA